MHGEFEGKGKKGEKKIKLQTMIQRMLKIDVQI